MAQDGRVLSHIQRKSGKRRGKGDDARASPKAQSMPFTFLHNQLCNMYSIYTVKLQEAK